MRLILVALILWAAVTRNVSAAGPARISPIQVEAAYLYNFTRFVEWPASSFSNKDAPLVIGILGQDPFGRLLDDLVQGEKINGRSLVVRRFKRVEEIGDCHVLFIARSEADQVRRICGALQNHHILTVSDLPNFTRDGGIIELVQEAERIRFRIALKHSRAELLDISAKLLRPAEVVSRPSPAFGPIRFSRVFINRARSLASVPHLFPAATELMRWSLSEDFSLPIFLR